MQACKKECGVISEYLYPYSPHHGLYDTSLSGEPEGGALR